MVMVAGSKVQSEFKHYGLPKESWEMTQEEYAKSQIGTRYRDSMGRLEFHSGREHEVRTDKYVHEAIVTRALLQGKNIPGEVLREYPDIRQKILSRYGQAFEDWASNKAYLDNAGNYRIKREGSQSGGMAPWNKLIKKDFPQNEDFHKAAHVLYPHPTEIEKPFAKPPAPSSPATKEPWQMTREEFDAWKKEQSSLKTEKWNKAGSKGFPPGLGIDTVAKRTSLAEKAGYVLPRDANIVIGMKYHELVVEAALHEGKPVPAEVLKDYPGLKAPKQARKPRIKVEKPKAVKPEPTEHKAPTTYIIDDTRSPRAIAIDRGIQAKDVVTRRNKEGVSRWKSHPNQMDVRGVDTLRTKAPRFKGGRVVIDTRGHKHRQKRGSVL